MQPTALQCTRCGTPAPSDAHFCGRCGGPVAAPPPPMAGACAACGTPLRPGAQFCARCGTAVGAAPVPQPAYAQAAWCPSCRNPLPAGAQFCGVCGALTHGGPAVAGSRAAAGPLTLQFTLRTIGADVAFALVLLGAFLDWVTANGFGFGAFEDNAKFRIGDWLDTSSFPIDGMLVFLLAALGLVVTGFATVGRLSDKRAALFTREIGSVAMAVGLLQMQYIKSVSSADWGIGLYLIVAGGILATLSQMLPARPLASSR